MSTALERRIRKLEQTRRACKTCGEHYVQWIALDDDDHEVKADPPACTACGRAADTVREYVGIDPWAV